MTFGEKLKKLRIENNLTQKDLADQLHVTFQTVSKWENDTNEPDFSTLKELSKILNCSIEELFSETDKSEQKEEPAEEEKVEEPTKNTNSFRKTYDSGIRLNSCNQADYEHAYYNGEKKINGYNFATYKSKHTSQLQSKKYFRTIRIQHDVLVEFFVDDKNKTFGFFFDGAPQFLCPFENFAGISITHSSPFNSYTKAPVLGVGIGKNPSLTVGSVPLGKVRAPLRYDCSISYFDEHGSIKIYKIPFGCNRMYITHDGTATTVEKLYFWEDSLSFSTNKNLNEIVSYLQGVKESGNRIRNGEISVPPIDMKAVVLEVERGQSIKRKNLAAYESAIEASKKRKTKIFLISLAVIAGLVTVSVATCSISKAVKENQIAQNNKKSAKQVMDLIDAIGTVTLASGPDIENAEYAYEQLTDEQKKLVTNYSTLRRARERYDDLLNEKLNEETKDDPSRTIVVADLNGRWRSNNNIEWAIDNIGGQTAVLYWVSNKQNASIIGSVSSSSVLRGYNNKTRRMDLRIYHYTMLGGEYLEASMTKSSTNKLTLYFGTSVFNKMEG